MKRQTAAALIVVGSTIASPLSGAAWALGGPLLDTPPNHATQPLGIMRFVSNCILAPNTSADCSVSSVFTRGEFAVAAQQTFGLPAPSETTFFADVAADSPTYASIQAAGAIVESW